jgi:nicotinamidase-related amidase
LVAVDDCIMVVIDMQDFFLRNYPAERSAQLVENTVWLCRLACHFQVPLLAVSEDSAAKGGINASVRSALPGNAPVFDKKYFSAAREPKAYQHIVASGRGTVVLVGVETDVCVAQTALDIMDHGMQAVVVTDATFSPLHHHELGLQRIRDAGGLAISVKGLYYEWARTVEACKVLRDQTLLLKQKPAWLIL